MRQPKFYNHWVLIIVLALVSIGLVMVLSASGGMADYRYGSPTKFYLNQAVSVIIGIFSMLFLYMPLS